MPHETMILSAVTAVVTLVLVFNPFRRPPTRPSARRRRGGQP
jgi:hypothetical protein